MKNQIWELLVFYVRNYNTDGIVFIFKANQRNTSFGMALYFKEIFWLFNSYNIMNLLCEIQKAGCATNTPSQTFSKLLISAMMGPEGKSEPISMFNINGSI